MNKNIKKIDTIDFPTPFGDFDLTLYETLYDNQPNMRFVLALETKAVPEVPLVRIHSECLLSEVFKNPHCDCRQQLEESLLMINNQGGILFYLDQEGRGHGLITKIKELKKQQAEGLDTVQASEAFGLKVDDRTYESVRDILLEKNIKNIKLLTNNPRKIQFLEDSGIKVSERVPLEIEPNVHNVKYLKAKKEKLSHMLQKYI